MKKILIGLVTVFSIITFTFSQTSMNFKEQSAKFIISQNSDDDLPHKH